jgi:Ca-activated chloride channel family protein
MKNSVGRMRWPRILALPGFILLLGLGGPVREKTEDGNRHYAEGNYDKALTSYVEARSHAEPQTSGGDEAEALARLHFNTGDALYKQKKYEEARKEYEQSLLSTDPEIQEKSYYNIGNTYFREATQKQSLDLLKQAAASYRQALELNPDDEDAKYNLEVVRRHIDLKQQEPTPSSRARGSDQKNQEQKQKSEQEQETQAESEAQKKGQEQKEHSGQKQDDRKFSREEAERILEALQEQEKEELKKSYQVPEQKSRGPEKDW